MKQLKKPGKDWRTHWSAPPDKPWQQPSRPIGCIQRRRRTCGEAPSWFRHLYDTRLARHADRRLCHALAKRKLDYDQVVFQATAGSKPHSYYW